MKLPRYFTCALVACFSVHTASAEEPVKLGAIYSMSGTVAQYGTWASNGAQLAVEDADYPIELIVEDSAGEATKAISAYQKLRTIDRVPIVSTMISTVALAVKPRATRDNVIQIDVSATAPGYSSPDGYQFRTGIHASQLATAAADYVGKQRAFQEIGCLYIENEFGQGMYNVFEQTYSGTIAVSETFRSGDSDFRTQLLKLKQAKVRAIWLVGSARESGLLVAQARQLGLDVPFFSDVYSIETPAFFAGVHDPGEIYYLAPRFDANSPAKSTKDFVRKYKATFGETPTAYAAQAYDAVIAMAKALQKCEGPNTTCLLRALRQLDFEGASGKINFDSSGDVFKELEIKKPVAGKFVSHAEYTNRMERTSSVTGRSLF